MAHAIEVSNLTKRFGDVLAVDDLSFTVDEGRIVGFLGPNGAGKTTTLRMLLGLVYPTAGSSTIHGAGYDHLDDPVHKVGAVLDGGMLHPGRTGRNHLRALAKSAGVPDARDGRAARARRAHRCREPPRRRLLARHAPAARPGGRPAGRPAGARARRARQRPRPAGHPLAARLPALARPRGAGRARLQPRAGRGLPDRRRRRGHQPRALGRPGHADRADRPQRRWDEGRRARTCAACASCWSPTAPTSAATPTSSCATAAARTSGA